MNKLFHLASCDTCKRIIKELDGGTGLELQNIKETPISADDLDYLRNKVGSYEALFSRRAMKYRSMGLKEKTLTEEDYRQLILDEYTFLKRPVLAVHDTVIAGSTKKNLATAKDLLGLS